MTRLAEQGAVGGFLVRLMMILQDFALANQGMTAFGRVSKKKKQGDVKRAAGRYFLRLQISHSYEALKLIKEIRHSTALTGLLLGCNKETKKAYEKLEAFLGTPDHDLMELIRNKVGFHYDATKVRNSLRRLERRRLRQIGKRKGRLKGIRKPIDIVNCSIARDMHKSEFVPWEIVENDIVLHDIFGLDESDTYADDKKLDAEADMIVMRLHEVQKVFSFFAANFILKYAGSK
jgi:hypothetical protein